MNFLLLRSKDKRMKKWGILGALLLVAGVLAYRPDTVRGANDSHAPIVITTDSEFQICNCVVSPQVPQRTRMSSARGPLTRRRQCPSRT